MSDEIKIVLEAQINTQYNSEQKKEELILLFFNGLMFKTKLYGEAKIIKAIEKKINEGIPKCEVAEIYSVSEKYIEIALRNIQLGDCLPEEIAGRLVELGELEIQQADTINVDLLTPVELDVYSSIIRLIQEVSLEYEEKLINIIREGFNERALDSEYINKVKNAIKRNPNKSNREIADKLFNS